MKIKITDPIDLRLPVGVSIIVVSATGNFILSRRLTETGHGQWQFPGGHVEAGETPLIAAVRELREETGLKVAPARLEHIGTEIAVGYTFELYQGFRYGLVLRPHEVPSNPEPLKHTDWEECHPSVLHTRPLIANNAHFARSYLFMLGSI